MDDKKTIGFNILTWNILSEDYIRHDEYEHLQEKLEWNTRLSCILDLLSRTNSDVICLQEVSLKSFETDFKDLLKDYHYHGHVIDKKRKSPMGNIILFRKKYTLLEKVIKTKAVHVKLQINDDFICCGVRSG